MGVDDTGEKIIGRELLIGKLHDGQMRIHYTISLALESLKFSVIKFLNTMNERMI